MNREYSIAGFLLTAAALPAFMASIQSRTMRETGALAIAFLAVGLVGGVAGAIGTRRWLPRVLLVANLVIATAAIYFLFFGTLLPRVVGPTPGLIAPPFALSDQSGQTVELERLRADGPVMVVFYRGFW